MSTIMRTTLFLRMSSVGHDSSHSKLRFTRSTMRVAWKFPRRNIGDAKRLEEELESAAQMKKPRNDMSGSEFERAIPTPLS